jgi:hypothetical protein
MSELIVLSRRDRDALKRLLSLSDQFLAVDARISPRRRRAGRGGATADFPAIITYTDIEDLNEVTEDEQWTYPWREAVRTWNDTDQVIEYGVKSGGRTSESGDPLEEDEDRFATNPMEGLSPASQELSDTNCPDPDEGDIAVGRNFKRKPLENGTLVYIRPVSTDDGTRFEIVTTMGLLNLCGYCPEPEEE